MIHDIGLLSISQITRSTCKINGSYTVDRWIDLGRYQKFHQQLHHSALGHYDSTITLSIPYAYGFANDDTHLSPTEMYSDLPSLQLVTFLHCALPHWPLRVFAYFHLDHTRLSFSYEYSWKNVTAAGNRKDENPLQKTCMSGLWMVDLGRRGW